ncbi:MAG TPA: hypothetical protein PLJ38_02120, partial [bacterium]|nr:hypothetical protein [bacterium]
NAYEIQEGINFLKFKNEYLYKVKNDRRFRESEIKRVGSEENLNIVVENLNNLTPSDVFNKTEQYYNLSKGLIEANTKIVYEEKSLETYRKLPQDIQNNIDLEKFLNSSPTEQQKMINWASNMINKEVSEFLNKIYGQTQETQNQQQIPEIDKNNRKQVLEFQKLYNSLNPNPNPNNKISEDGIWGKQTEWAFNKMTGGISKKESGTELEKLQNELSNKRKNLHMLLQFKYQTPQIKAAVENTLDEIEKLQSLITSEKLSRERKKLFPPQTRAQTRESEKEADKLSGLQARLNMARRQLFKDPENTKLKNTIMSLERDIAAITKEAPLTTKTPQAVQPKLSAYLQNLNRTALRDLSSKNKNDKNVILVKGFLNNPEKYDLSSNDKIDELISAFKELKRQELSELFTNRTDLTTYDTIIGELEKLVQQKPYSKFEVKNSN